MVAGQILTATHEVVLGINNAYSVINEGVYGKHLVREDHAEILSCSEYREFWIEWDPLSIAVGKGGNIGQSEYRTNNNQYISNQWL